MFSYITNTITNYLEKFVNIMVKNITPLEHYHKLLIDTNNYYQITNYLIIR